MRWHHRPTTRCTIGMPVPIAQDRRDHRRVEPASQADLGVPAHDNYFDSVWSSEPTLQDTPDDADGWPLDLAVDVLAAVSQHIEGANEKFLGRSRVLKQQLDAKAHDADTSQQQHQAYIEHLHTTIQALYAELDRNPRSVNIVGAVDPIPPLAHGRNGSTLPAVASIRKPQLTNALARSPLAARITPSSPRLFSVTPSSLEPQRGTEWTNLLGRKVEQRLVRHPAAHSREGTPNTEVETASMLISGREERIKEILKENGFWQHEYQAMREQVVAEKLRQVELFQRLETQKRDHSERCDTLERALREAQHENELLKSQLAEVRVKLSYQASLAKTVLHSAKEEKESLVCTIAETRHKFKEWKDGEAATLKAARDQAVHTLKTEYELKIARHHLEKQKLRDKVKDLEVSLRLLQKDRHLSPQELSLRKATILGGKDAGATSEAELIEAHCRIKELEALLDHAKEYQKRQESIIKTSENAITKLEQEREVVALEHATFAQPLNMLVPFDTQGGIGMGRSGSAVSLSGAATSRNRRSSKPVQGGDSAKPSGHAPLLRAPSIKSMHPSGDAEKEILRRQSVVLTAEVEKYRHLVVQSLDEIRALRDNRRRSLMSPAAGTGTNGNSSLVTAREQYLMNEIVKVQQELDELKARHKRKPQSKRGHHGDRRTSSSSDSSCSSESDLDHESDHSGTETDQPQLMSARTIPVDDKKMAAVLVIQNQSKTFRLRRDFIKKKRAVDRIKAQYRGYLVRKNMELLDRTHRPFVVTDAIQAKMQIVAPHHSMEIHCGHKQLKIVLKVSKDPPVVQTLLNEMDQPEATTPRVFYFHLFEIVALLPLEEETRVLAKLSEAEIAQLLGSLLYVVNRVGEYRFVMARPAKRPAGPRMPYEPPMPSTGSYLTHLLVQETRPVPEGSKLLNGPNDRQANAEATNEVATGNEELDALIQLSRCPPIARDDVSVSAPSFPSPDTSATSADPPRTIMRRRSSSLESIPETAA